MDPIPELSDRNRSRPWKREGLSVCRFGGPVTTLVSSSHRRSRKFAQRFVHTVAYRPSKWQLPLDRERLPTLIEINA